jgi:hypothetical protein
MSLRGRMVLLSTRLISSGNMGTVHRALSGRHKWGTQTEKEHMILTQQKSLLLIGATNIATWSGSSSSRNILLFILLHLLLLNISEFSATTLMRLDFLD